jgi:hypothetical protein
LPTSHAYSLTSFADELDARFAPAFAVWE